MAAALREGRRARLSRRKCTKDKRLSTPGECIGWTKTRSGLSPPAPLGQSKRSSSLESNLDALASSVRDSCVGQVPIWTRQFQRGSA